MNSNLNTFKSLLGSLSPRAWVRVIIIVQLLLLGWQFTPEPCTDGDNAVLFILGKSFVTGHGFHNLHLVGEPVETTMPFLFPLVLGLCQIVFKTPLFAQILMGLLGVASTLLVYRLFKNLPNIMLFPLLSMVAASHLIARYSLNFMSEILYVAVTLLALVLLRRSLDQPKNILLFGLTILVSLMPLHTRSIGIAFSAAWIVTLLFERRFRYAIVHAAALGLVAFIIKLMAPGDSGYGFLLWQRDLYDPQVGTITPIELVDRFAENFQIHFNYIIGGSFIPFTRPPSPALIGTISKIVIAFSLIGWFRNLFQSTRIISVYLFMYMGIVLVWPIPNDRRIACIIPFLFLFLLQGIDYILSLFSSRGSDAPQRVFAAPAGKGLVRNAKIVLVLMTALVVIPNLTFRLATPGFANRLGPDWDNFYSCADWVRFNTPRDAVIMSRKPELLYLRADRKGLVYPYSHDIEVIIKSMRDNNVSYIVFDNFGWTRTTAKYLYPAIVSRPELFKVVYAVPNPEFFVMEFNRTVKADAQ